MRGLVPAVALFLLAFPAVAGPEPAPVPPEGLRAAEAAVEEQCLALLASGDPKEVAWGAVAAGRYGIGAAVPDLCAALRRAAEAEPPVSLLLAVFDALIRLGARPPAEVLLPFVSRGGLWYPSLVVLAVKAREPETLLAILAEAEERRAEHCFVAAGNTLAELRAPGFAERLLAGLTVELTIVVRNRKRPADVRRPVGNVCGDGWFDLPEGYPPVAVYEIDDIFLGDETLLADGARRVWYERSVHAPGRHGWGNQTGGLDWDLVRAEWLGRLLGQEAPALDVDPDAGLGWRGPERFLEQAAAARRRAARAWEKTVERLVEMGLLSGERAAKLRLRLETEVWDQRKSKAREAPLPQLPESPDRPEEDR